MGRSGVGGDRQGRGSEMGQGYTRLVGFDCLEDGVTKLEELAQVINVRPEINSSLQTLPQKSKGCLTLFIAVRSSYSSTFKLTFADRPGVSQKSHWNPSVLKHNVRRSLMHRQNAEAHDKPAANP